LEDPDILILDEPTNYLDLDALEWLESYLMAWARSLLVISHDRYFLDQVVTRVWELNHGCLETYRGNYSRYVEQREARLERRQREYEAQQAFIAKTEDFIRRYKAGQRTREAQGRETRLARLERLEAPKRNKHIRLHLETDLRAGDNVLATDGVVIGYRASPNSVGQDLSGSGADTTHGEFPLFETGPFLIQRGDRVALLGPNGSGKTTFLRTLLGQLEPLAGNLRIGASLNMGYLPQDQSWLAPDKRVLDQILDMSDYTLQEARDLLGRFLFSGDDVFKMTGDLSGGELARVALAVLSIDNPNFLILDEPTTHLDVASQEILQNVLTDYDGTVLLVSHDRYLIDALATHVFWIQDGQLLTIEGNYTAYTTFRREQRALSDRNDTEADPREEQRLQQRREQAAERRRLERMDALEDEIEQVERELAVTSGMIERASQRQDVERLHKLGGDYERLQSALAQKLHEWERVSSVKSNVR
jgi:ATP-binding cassette subfamily F protein 3